MFAGQRIIVLDLEVANSPDDVPSGWNDKRALGLSIGGYYSYVDGEIHWFDQENLAETMQKIVEQQPCIVSFNGIGFDSLVMAECIDLDPTMRTTASGIITEFVDGPWHSLWRSSYDILAEIWKRYGRNTERGLNSLDSILAANGLRPKTGHGAWAPKLWQQGKIAEVINYCQNDILRTKELFELISRQEGRLQRRTGPIHIRYVSDCSIGLADANVMYVRKGRIATPEELT